MRLLGIAASIGLIVSVAAYRMPEQESPSLSHAGSAPELSPRLPQIIHHQLALTKAPIRMPAESLSNTQYLDALDHALAPYRDDKFSEAIRRLEYLADRYPKSVEPTFYLGVARLMIGEPTRALKALNEARRIGGRALENDILWYIAVAHERTGAMPEARPKLQRLCVGESVYRIAACAALRTALR